MAAPDCREVVNRFVFRPEYSYDQFIDNATMVRDTYRIV